MYSDVICGLKLTNNQVVLSGQNEFLCLLYNKSELSTHYDATSPDTPQLPVTSPCNKVCVMDLCTHTAVRM